MLSLNARFLLVASLVLASFLTLMGLALDRAFRQSAHASAQARLHGQVLLLLSATEFGDKQLQAPKSLPEPRLNSPASGLFAEIVDDANQVVWRSKSTLLDIDYPTPNYDGIGNFALVPTDDGTSVFGLNFGVSWELDDETVKRFEFRVAESSVTIDEQLGQFRRGLVLWFSSAAVVLLFLQGLILRWGLAPIRRLANEVTEIEAGGRESFVGTYPRELRGLTANLNVLVAHSRNRLSQYRNALDDLAHSLKTPLAVLRSVTEGKLEDSELEGVVRSELDRMHQTIDYQLQRAAVVGRAPLSVPVLVAPVVERLSASLYKVYADKSLHINVDMGNVLFHGDEGDLTELLGNLMDNACKWANTRVRVTAGKVRSSESQSLYIEVSDDGPGLSETCARNVFGRGVRSTDLNAGQGIGLAVVREIVEEMYTGKVELARGELGGACVRLEF